MIELTIEQHSSVLADPQTPKRVLDPVSKEVFVLLPEHTYEQVCRQLLAEGSGEMDVGQLVEDAMTEYDADDPLLSSCQTAKAECPNPDVERLLGCLDRAKNVTPIGRLRREEIYDRAIVR